MRISLTEVLEVNFVGGKLFVKYCIRSTCKYIDLATAKSEASIDKFIT